MLRLQRQGLLLEALDNSRPGEAADVPDLTHAVEARRFWTIDPVLRE
jgi:hypothetical protein